MSEVATELASSPGGRPARDLASLLRVGRNVRDHRAVARFLSVAVGLAAADSEGLDPEAMRGLHVLLNESHSRDVSIDHAVQSAIVEAGGEP